MKQKTETEREAHPLLHVLDMFERQGAKPSHVTRTPETMHPDVAAWADIKVSLHKVKTRE